MLMLHAACCILHSAVCCHCRPVYSVAEVAAAVLGMMDKMRVGKACFVAHSYGERTRVPP
jgi:hypothetical protein